jgi:hypothetical protein
VAQGLLFKRGAAAAEQARVVWCHRTVTSKWGDVAVYRAAGESAGARFSGITTCGSVWACPVCCAKIAGQRRRELSLAMREALDQGVHGYLLSLTFPHSRDDPLAQLLARFSKALASFKNSRRFKGWSSEHERMGSVRSLEVTWGVNGWHPHTHDLIFARPGALEDLRGIRILRSAWLRAALRAGLLFKRPGERVIPLSRIRDFWKHGLDLRGGDRAAEYIAKFGRDERWGISSELTAMHSKCGIRKFAWTDSMHFAPFQLLEWARNGDAAAAAMFREYAFAFEGKRMLSWSRGLRASLRVVELSDEDAANSPMPGEVFCGVLTVDQYQVLLSRNWLGQFLSFVSLYVTDPSCSQDDIKRQVDWIRATIPPRMRSTIRRPDRAAADGYSMQEGVS